MTYPEHQSTRAYRDELATALKVAQLRLSPADFEATASGVRAEILRLNADLEHNKFEEPLGLSSDLPLAWRFVDLVQGTLVKLRQQPAVAFNSPSDSAPWYNYVPRSIPKEREQIPISLCPAE